MRFIFPPVFLLLQRSLIDMLTIFVKISKLCFLVKQECSKQQQMLICHYVFHPQILAFL